MIRDANIACRVAPFLLAHPLVFRPKFIACLASTAQGVWLDSEGTGCWLRMRSMAIEERRW